MDFTKKQQSRLSIKMSASIYITNLFFQSTPESSTPEKPRFLSFQI